MARLHVEPAFPGPTMAHTFLADILILLAIAVVFVGVSRRLHLPSPLGYLCAGIVAGPHALGWFDDGEVAHLLGEIGVAFLLFAIGLHFSVSRLLSMRRVLLGLGAAQVLTGTVTGAGIAWWLGIPWAGAVIVGGALAMSSTAVVVKQLTDQFEIQSRHGTLAVGVLLFQDLAAVPFLVMIPVLASADGEGLWLALGTAILKGLLAFAVMLIFGRIVLQRLFHEVARADSVELFTLTVLLVSLFAAWLTSLLGLSLVLGAFLAGMMLSETAYRHQIDAELRPFRDILLGLFFVVVGMTLDVSVLPSAWPWVLLLVAGLTVGKGSLIALLTWRHDADLVTAVRTGVILGHGGEFGLALLALALGTGLLSASDSQPILAAIILSMLIAPLLIRHHHRVANRLLPASEPPDVPPDTIADADGHVIICGFGRVGQQLARLLADEGIDSIGLENDPDRVRQAGSTGANVYFGDGARAEMLRAIGLDRAAAVVVSFADDPSAKAIVRAARAVRRDLPILVRCEEESSVDAMLDAGATDVVPETLETTVVLTTQLMHQLGKPAERTDELVRRIRRARHASPPPGAS